MRLQSQWQARYCQCRSEQERVRRFPGCSPAPAYRGDLPEKRRWLMEAWASYAGAARRRGGPRRCNWRSPDSRHMMPKWIDAVPHVPPIPASKRPQWRPYVAASSHPCVLQTIRNFQIHGLPAAGIWSARGGKNRQEHESSRRRCRALGCGPYAIPPHHSMSP